MTTSPAAPRPTAPAPTGSDQRGPLRIRLSDILPSTGPLDGAWWPRSRDLQSEAADLVDHFPSLAGRVERLLFSRPDWEAVEGAPSRHSIRAARGPVKTGSFPRDDTHVMMVKTSAGEHLRLLVVPSDTEPGRAARLMEQAADPQNTKAPRALLGLS